MVEFVFVGKCILVNVFHNIGMSSIVTVYLSCTSTLASVNQNWFYFSGITHLGSPGQRAVKRVYVCMYVCMYQHLRCNHFLCIRSFHDAGRDENGQMCVLWTSIL